MAKRSTCWTLEPPCISAPPSRLFSWYGPTVIWRWFTEGHSMVQLSQTHCHASSAFKPLCTGLDAPLPVTNLEVGCTFVTDVQRLIHMRHQSLHSLKSSEQVSPL